MFEQIKSEIISLLNVTDEKWVGACEYHNVALGAHYYTGEKSEKT